ncbi:MAG TPA: extracellular solute-binding protein [bacterium]|jgi:ABC-type sugar transport system permease subunit/ABC-type glycerol-3-phosphate transport system substrate-binding protein|nr:extracellular solute-binding protein [bacterium]
MKTWKVIVICVLGFGLMWLLSPSRSQQASEPGVVEITFMGQSGPIADATDDAVRVFEKRSRDAHAKDPSKPIYRVISGQNASRSPSEDPTRFLVSLAGGEPPDVITFDRFAVSEWAARGAFTPLEPYINADLKSGREDSIHSEDYFESAWNETIYTNPQNPKDHGVYGIPFKMDSRALFYNKNLLKRGGFVDSQGEAQPPRTWEETETMASKLTEVDDQGHVVRMGYIPNQGNTFLYLFGWQNGGEFMSADGRRCTLNDPKIVDALDWLTRVYDKLGGAKLVTGFQSSFQGGDLDPFIIGKIALKIDGVWQLDNMAQYANQAHLEWGAADPPMPAAEVAKGHKTLSWVGGWCYSIPSTAKHKDAAWELIRFLSSPEAVKIMSESQRLTAQSQGRAFVPYQHPNRKINDWLAQTYVYDDPNSDPQVKQAMRVFNDLLTKSRYRPVTVVGQLLWNQDNEAFDNAINHKATPKKALDDATAVVQRDLDIALRPPEGVALKWSWILWPYLVLVVLGMWGIYLWDTRHGFRAKVASKLGRFGKRVRDSGGDVEGLHSNFLRAQWKDGWILAAPWTIGFIVFTGGPLLFSIIISFCRYDIINAPRLVGLVNYKVMFSQDPLFWKSLWNTVYMVIGIPVGMALSLGLSLLLNTKVKGVAVWRTLFYMPSIIPAVASTILWIWIFNPSSGLLNVILASVGIHGPNWLQDENTSKLSLILMGLWSAGGGIIIWLAGLKGISESYYEAAAIDGADSIDKFFNVTLPMLTPYIFFNLIMSLIATFQWFTQPFIMTQGGPVNSTLSYVYFLFNSAFRYLKMGYSASAAWFLFLIVFVLTLIQLRYSKRWVHYEGD